MVGRAPRSLSYPHVPQVTPRDSSEKTISIEYFSAFPQPDTSIAPSACLGSCHRTARLDCSLRLPRARLLPPDLHHLRLEAGAPPCAATLRAEPAEQQPQLGTRRPPPTPSQLRRCRTFAGRLRNCARDEARPFDPPLPLPLPASPLPAASRILRSFLLGLSCSHSQSFLKDAYHVLVSPFFQEAVNVALENSRCKHMF